MRHVIPKHMTAATDLGTRVIGSTDNSMFVKRYWDIVSIHPQGRELTILWLKLNCLIFALWGRNTQILRAVSCQPMVGCTNHGEPCGRLIMCLPQFRGSNEFTMSSLNGLNGKPKGFTTNFIGLRRNKKNMGSPYFSTRRVFSCFALREGDGGPIVPYEGRGLPPLSEFTSNESVIDYSPPINFIKVAKSWATLERSYKGVKIPPKFAKLYKYNSNPKSVFDNLYSILLIPEMYDLAYQRIKSKPGNMTPGVTPTTLSGWGPEVISKIISKMADESFQFSTSRLIEIPKPHGGKRPLKIAPPRDKVVQRIITDILEAIYEPIFSRNSYGFRPNSGCHDALYHIKQTYQGTRWFIEGDIAKCFDTIDHDILIALLRRKIRDERFIRLIRKSLRAGYLNVHRVPQDCLIGTPQGSIVSPILCNIIMNEFDYFVEQTLGPTYNRGKSRKQPASYKSLLARSNYYGKKYKRSKNKDDLNKSRELRALAQKSPSTITNDPSFRRLYYTRYADDWLIGFAGPYHEAKAIRNLCKDFLMTLGLELNLEKTLITKASKGCIFLGTKIHVPLNQERFKKAKFLTRANLGVRLNAPLDRIIRKLATAGYCDLSGRPLPRMALYAADKEEIIKVYSSVYRGILNYYSFADNYTRLALSLFNILRNSAAKVLAAKLKLRTVRQVLLKYGKFIKIGKNRFPDYKDPNFRGIPFKRGSFNSRILIFRSASLTMRSGTLACAVCSSTYKIEMHHVRMLKDLHRRSDPISLAMAARKRKQVPLCRAHHMGVHVNINTLRRSLRKQEKNG